MSENIAIECGVGNAMIGPSPLRGSRVTKTHALAMYGPLDTSPSRLFKETDAKDATECASDANSCLTTLLNLARLGRLEVK